MKGGNGKRGFTIVELIVVIAVIAILAAVLVPTFTNVIKSARETADRQTMNALNKMLAVGEIEAEEIKQYKLRNEDWELAYSYVDNETVIVDKSGKIVAASDEKVVGTTIGEEYVLASEIEEASGGNTPGGNDKPNTPNEGNWENATRVESDLSSSGEQFKDEKELYICDNVASIPQRCFSGNGNLERIYIGAGIKGIPTSTFEGCVKLKEVYIAGDGIEIGSDAFYGCAELEKINLEKVKNIGLRAFANCSKLTNVTLNSLESIGKNAFKGCGIKEMELPESLQTMYYDSMNGCTLAKLTIKSGAVVQEVEKNGVDISVRELAIGGEERIEISESLWIYIRQLVDKSAATLKKVTIKNITVNESEWNTRPFMNLSQDAQIIIEDNESYISILGGRSESEVFGCVAENIIKQWS